MSANDGIFSYISNMLGIPTFIPIIIFAILILGMFGLILFAYKKISDTKTDDENK